MKIISLYRFGNFFYKRRIVFFPRLFSIIIRLLFSAEIPSTCIIGKNVKFKHGGLGVVIHDRVTLGDDCTIYQNVTIGSIAGKGPPLIGNNVTIGCGAIILGDIVISDNSIIGPNSVVLDDVCNGQKVHAPKGIIFSGK